MIRISPCSRRFDIFFLVKFVVKYSLGTYLMREDNAPVFLAVVLLFYVHGKHLRSCRDGQLTRPIPLLS